MSDKSSHRRTKQSTTSQNYRRAIQPLIDADRRQRKIASRKLQSRAAMKHMQRRN